MKPLKLVTAWQSGSGAVLFLLVVIAFSAMANAQAITLAEAVDNASLVWTTGGDAEWFGQTSVYFYGGDAARSGRPPTDGTSWISTTVTGPGILHFYCTVDERYYHGGFFRFDVDEIRLGGCQAKIKNISSWWEWKAYQVPTGSHVLKWSVSYDAPSYVGAGFLDKVIFAQGPGPTLGEALDNTDLVWTTGGTDNKEWFGQTEEYYFGGSAARSGEVSSGQSSWIETTVALGFLSFYWRGANFGSYTWPTTYFQVDGITWRTLYGDYSSGWGNELVVIPSGSHTLRWIVNPTSGEYGARLLDKVTYIPGPALMVRQPNGGETVPRRNFYKITWLTTEGVGPLVKLELYCGDQLRQTIAASTENDGAHDWLVPLQLATETNCRIKVTSVSDLSVYDYSDAVFAIGEASLPDMGGLLLLDGIDDGAWAVDDVELDVGDEEGEALTVETWFNPLSEEDATIVGKRAYRLLTKVRSDWSGTWGCWEGGLWFQDSTGHDIGSCHSLGSSTRVWHHVALVYDRPAALMSLYVDGRRAVTATATSLLANTPDVLLIGDHLNGAIDEVRISDVARYSGATYSIPTAPFACDAHTRALWHFDEYEGATVFHDACGTDNVLVGYNGAHTVGIPTRRVYLPLVLR